MVREIVRAAPPSPTLPRKGGGGNRVCGSDISSPSKTSPSPPAGGGGGGGGGGRPPPPPKAPPPRLARGGKSVYGARLGILMLEAGFPRIPGDMGNAETWPFPVLYRVVTGASPQRVVRER